AIDVGFDRCGVQAEWQGPAASWSGWLPHVNLDVARTLTQGSAEHDLLWKLLATPGKLKLRTRLNLWQMLRPAVQEGARLDHVGPPEKVPVAVRSRSVGFEVTPADKALASPSKPGDFGFSFTRTPAEGELTPLEISVPTGKQIPFIDISYSTN